MTPRSELRVINSLVLPSVKEAIERLRHHQNKLNQRRAENTTLALVRELQMIETIKCNKILKDM